MKNAFTLLLCTFFGLNVIQSQVLEETRIMAQGSQPALTIVLPGADSKFVDTGWKEYMKSYGKVVRVKGAKENLAADVQVLDIGGVTRLNIHSLTEEVADGTKMVVWIDMGTGFISSEAFPKEYVASVQFLKNFADKVKTDLITLELEEQEKILKKAENNLSELKRKNDNYHKIIEDSKKRIAEAEKDIEQNLKDQDLAHKEIEAQKEVVGGVKKKLEDSKKD